MADGSPTHFESLRAEVRNEKTGTGNWLKPFAAKEGTGNEEVAIVNRGIDECDEEEDKEKTRGNGFF